MAEPLRDLAVRSTRIVTEAGVGPGLVIARDGVIVEVADIDAELPPGALAINAGDAAVLPGLVDTHVHVNEPGRADWEGWATASAAAAAGGVTTVVDMPLNSVPATTTIGALDQKLACAAGVSHVDYACWGGVVPGNVGELAALVEAGVPGFKCFMVDSGVPEFAAVTWIDLERAMPELARLGVPLLVHAESEDELLEWNGPVTSHAAWAATRPTASEVAAAVEIATLAERHDCRVHIVHVSSPETLAALERFGPLVSAETCPHYLAFTGDEVPDGATQFKCAPPLRSAADRDGLRQAVLDPSSRIDLVVSDHSPSPPDLKCLEEGDFARAWGGIASLQVGLSATWTSVPGMELRDVARLMSLQPARLAGLARKGRIAAGADADLVIFDPDAQWTLDPADLLQRHPVTPYAGRELRGRVTTTILRGQVIYDRGAMSSSPTGRPAAAPHS